MPNTDNINIPLTGGEALTSRWFEDSEDRALHLLESIENGDFTMTTLFATKLNPDGPGLIALVLEDGNNTPEELMPEMNLEDVKQTVASCYGADALRVPMSRLNREIESRSYHTVEMIELLEKCDNYDHVGLTSYIVYGAALRPMSASWVRIENAVYIQTSKPQTGYHTYVAVPADLDKEVIDQYELTFISRPSVK